MTAKTKQIVEMIAIFIFIVIIVSLAQPLVALGGSVPVKMVFTLLIYVVMIGAVVLICKIKRIPLAAALGFTKKNIGKQILIAIPIFALTVALFVGIPFLLGFNKEDILSFKASSIGILAFYIIYDMFFVGFGEEIIFRGYFFGSLRKVTNSGWLSVIISAVLFGLSHYPNNPDLLGILFKAIIGFIYGFCRLKIKDCSTLSTGIAHGLNDTFILILSYTLL